MNVDAAGQKITRPAICLLFAAALFLPSSVSAEPITVTPLRITGGALVSDAEGVGRLIVAGEGGFGLSGTGDFRLFFPYGQCVVATDCAPGTPLSLAGHWSGSDFNGELVFGGQLYPVGIWTSENASAILNFSGSFVAPEFDGTLTSEVSAPFGFAGEVLLPAVPPLHTLQLSGSGMATIRLRWSDTASERGWRFDGAAYAFDTSAVPEPGTVALVGLGLAGVASRRARRRQSSEKYTVKAV